MNYPPGMSRSDMDHVEGRVRCIDCGADISREWENDECVAMDAPSCPGGCDEGPDPDDLRDREFDRAGGEGRW